MIQGVTPQIESVLAAGHHAWSNMNTQPWRFVVRGNLIEIFSVPERDTSILNAGGRASILAIGGVIENIAIAATAFGFKADIQYFPPGDPSHVATIDLKPEPGRQINDLEQAILLRASNRKKFLVVHMSETEMRTINAVESGSTDLSLYISEERGQVETLAKAAAVGDEIIFSNPSLRTFFLDHVRWSEAEGQAMKDGIDFKNLELTMVEMGIMYMLKYAATPGKPLDFNIGSFVNRRYRSIYKYSGSICAITANSDDPQAILNAGRFFEKLWLKFTKLGVSLEPIPTIPLLKLHIDLDKATDLDPQATDQVNKAYTDIKKALTIESKRIVCLFRVGSGMAPSGHTPRRDLKDVISIA